MRIAVLVYGRLKYCVEHYNNIINSIGKENNIIDFFMSSDNSPNIEDFIKLYKPLDYTNDKIEHNYNFKKYNGVRVETNIDNMTRHFINKNRVFTLFEKYVEKNNINYDVIISLRLNLLFKNKFIFNTIENNKIYIPKDYDPIPKSINDMVAYGNFNVMKKYNNIINNVDELLTKNLTIPHPESLTLANIIYNNINIVRTNVEYDFKR